MQWTDEMQRRADRMEGLRFYLPRPFVNVFESFPVRTDVYLAQGVVSPDGQYVVLTDVVPEAALAHRAEHYAMPRVPEDVRFKVPIGYIRDARGPTGAKDGSTTTADGANGTDTSIQPQGLGRSVGRDVLLQILAGDDSPLKVDALGLDGSTLANILQGYFDERRAMATQPAPTTPLVPPIEPGARTGRNSRGVLNDNSLFAHQALRGNFDVVYLPDFEEQYVVSSFAGLGDASFFVNMGQGWSLQGFRSLADNSEINRRIFDLVDTAVSVAKTAAFGALGFAPPGGAIQPQGLSAAGARQDFQFKDVPGTPVTLKFVIVHYAAKGLYPVLKPREIQERLYGHATHYCVLDLFKLFPGKRQASLVSGELLEGVPDATAAAKVDPEPARPDGQAAWGHWTTPVYPYQYVSFNTFRYVAIEAIRATGERTSPFEFLYPGTGTAADRGLAREDTVTLPPSARPGGANGAPAALGEVERAVNAAGFVVAHGSSTWMFGVQQARVTSQPTFKLSAILDEVPRGGAPNERATRLEFIHAFRAGARAILADQGYDVPEQDIDLSFGPAFEAWERS